LNEEEQHFGLTGTCSFCGDASVAHWTQRKTVEVCRECAETVLPVVIADAVISSDPAHHAERSLERVTSAYWKAVAGAVVRARDDRRSVAGEARE